MRQDKEETLRILISNQSELPIYVQIKEQLKDQILDGTIKEGEVLPSIRKLAKELKVSVITTTRAYNDLEQEGFIASMQGKGSVVLAKDNNQLTEQYYERISQNIKEAVRTAKKIQMQQTEFEKLCSFIWEDKEK